MAFGWGWASTPGVSVAAETRRAVEACAGMTYTRAQLDVSADGIADRILTIPDHASEERPAHGLAC